MKPAQLVPNHIPDEHNRADCNKGIYQEIDHFFNSLLKHKAKELESKGKEEFGMRNAEILCLICVLRITPIHSYMPLMTVYAVGGSNDLSDHPHPCPAGDIISDDPGDPPGDPKDLHDGPGHPFKLKTNNY